MYEDFSGQARKAIHLAHREAQRLRHDYLGTEHLLHGVVREGSDGVRRLLASCGVEAAAACREVEGGLTPGSDEVPWDKLPLTPATKRALEHARAEAARLGHTCVGPEHLLVGILHEPDSSAAQALVPLGLSADKLRQELARMPAPENRDWMLRAEVAPGLSRHGDPAAADLEAVLTAEPVPDEAVPRRRRTRRRRVSENLRLTLDDADLDLPVVEKQLRALQMLVAVVAGVVLGIAVFDWPGGVVGGFCGGIVASIRNGILGMAAGFAAGTLGGWLLTPAHHIGCIPGAIAGIALGACLGDWRNLPVPPGTDSGPAVPSTINEDFKSL